MLTGPGCPSGQTLHCKAWRGQEPSGPGMPAPPRSAEQSAGAGIRSHGAEPTIPKSIDPSLLRSSEPMRAAPSRSCGQERL